MAPATAIADSIALLDNRKNTMPHPTTTADSGRYARCIDISRRVRWDIDKDVIRGRSLRHSNKFLPDGLSFTDRLEFLYDDEKRFLSQVQGRTYANIFGLVERYINAKVLELSREHWFGDQTALEALVRFSDEELKHQELFRRVERLAADCMPPGYRFTADPNEVARTVLGKSTWSVLALTCHIELFTQLHFKCSIEPAAQLSPLWKDVFLYHWKEEAQHAVLDEIEWRREDAKLDPAERNRGVSDLIDLVLAVDAILQQQAAADTGYFIRHVGRSLDGTQQQRLGATILDAYRHQYIVSGIEDGRFLGILTDLIDDAQTARVTEALAPLMPAH